MITVITLHGLCFPWEREHKTFMALSSIHFSSPAAIFAKKTFISCSPGMLVKQGFFCKERELKTKEIAMGGLSNGKPETLPQVQLSWPCPVGRRKEAENQAPITTTAYTCCSGSHLHRHPIQVFSWIAAAAIYTYLVWVSSRWLLMLLESSCPPHMGQWPPLAWPWQGAGSDSGASSWVFDNCPWITKTAPSCGILLLSLQIQAWSTQRRVCAPTKRCMGISLI